jgi:NAD(P)-dependent dehydrogenase (short-subunit alcohol dehydrogenase family)
MKSKIILVTGASDGIGKVTAISLANQGHTIIIHGRNLQKTKAVYEEIKRETGNHKIDMILADLLSFSDVKRMADEIKKKYDHLDILINNAGNQFGGTRSVTADGHEKTMMVNTFSPFLLTYLLIDHLNKSEEGRVVTVTSASHDQGGKPFMDDIELENHYSYTKVYGVSKLYIIWVMRHFTRYCKEKGIHNVTFNCVHPGTAKSNLGNTGDRPFMMKVLFFVFIGLFGTSTEAGAAPTLFAATSEEMYGMNDKYIGPKGYEKAAERFYSFENEKIIWDYCVKVSKPYLF